MAKNYVIASSYATVAVISQTEVADVQATRIYTQPHGTYVVVNVPLKAFTSGHEDEFLAPVATTIEALWHDGFITGASYGQDIDPRNGLLAGFVYFKVTYQPGNQALGPFSTVVPVPVTGLSSKAAFTNDTSGQSYGEQIAAAYAQLAGSAGQ